MPPTTSDPTRGALPVHGTSRGVLPTALAVVAVVAVLVLGSAGTASAAPPAPPHDPPPLVAGPRSAEHEATLAAAAGAARADGSVRLLVSLNVPTAPEGSLTPEGVGRQRRTVESAQQLAAARLGSVPGVRIEHTYHIVPGLLVTATPAGVDALAASPLVASVEEDLPARADLSESVPLIGGVQAHALGYDGTGWNEAILDTGVQADHPFLAGRVVSEDCYSFNSFCPNGSTSQTGPGSAAPCTYLPASCSHGTHVAGIAAGKGTSFSGVAPGAGIIAIQIFTEVTGSLCGSDPGASPCNLTLPSDQLQGLERVYELRTTYRISSVNMSIGGLTHTGACDSTGPLRAAAAANLKSAGIALVAAAGNESANGIDDPACYSSSVSVGSTTKSDVMSGFSNNASNLSLLAPGSNINSSVPGGGFAFKSGTSMATPHVTGAWAVMKQQDPTASVDTILGKLQTTGLPITDTRFGAPIVKPRIQLFAALGSPTTAAGARYTPLPPTRVLDTRTALGTTAGPVSAGDVRSFSLPPGLVPADATAVALNLTGTEADAPAAVVLYPGGAAEPSTTSLIVQPGFAVANLVVVPLGPGQQLQLDHTGGALQLIGDVEGYYGLTGGAWASATPTRLVDTRIDLGTTGGAFGPDEARTLTVPASARPAGTTVAALDITLTDSTGLGFVTAHRAGAPRPATSSLNPAPYRTLPNLVFVELDASGQFELYNAAATTHVVIDLVGTFSTLGGLSVLSTPPTRVLDTRTGGPGAKLTTSTYVTIPTSVVPNTASAVIVHVTALDASAPTFLSTSATAPPPALPPTSMLNVVPGDMTGNLAIIPNTTWIGPPAPVFSFVLSNWTGDVDVVMDVVGYVN